jgi:uncharacterized phiE125 gp8 family phage protein
MPNPVALRLVTPPSALPVSLADAKLHLKVDHDADDALITLMLKAAGRGAEQELNRALMSQTWELRLDAFPEAEIELPKPRVLSVSGVAYTDAAGAEQTLSGSLYTLDADMPPGWLLPALGTNWPDTRDQANAVRITFVAGYGSTPESLPEDLRVWILLHLGATYRNREAFSAGVSAAELPGRFAPALLDAQRYYG